MSTNDKPAIACTNNNYSHESSSISKSLVPSAKFLECIQKDVIQCGRIIFPNKHMLLLLQEEGEKNDAGERKSMDRSGAAHDLSIFLQLFPPTQIVIPGCAWIQVHNPNRTRGVNDDDDDDADDDVEVKEESGVASSNSSGGGGGAGAGAGATDGSNNSIIYLDTTDDDDDEQPQPQPQPKKQKAEKQQQQAQVQPQLQPQQPQTKETPHDVLIEFAQFGNARISAATKEQYRNRLLASANVTCGKWMIFLNSQQVEAVWNVIATKVFQGELGCSAKVNNKKASSSRVHTTGTGLEKQEQEGRGTEKKKWYERNKHDDDKHDEEEEEEDDTFVICVYVDDFRKEEDVRRVLRVLLRIEGVTITAGFKPDFVTYLGLYADKARNPKCYHNAHKLGVTTIYKEMLKEEKQVLTNTKTTTTTTNNINNSKSET